jgi:hypothetical protein
MACAARLVLTMLTALGALSANALADPFNNLDFEDSPYPADAPYSLSAPTMDLFPYWTVRYANSVQTNGSLNTYLLAGPATALLTSASNPLILQGQKTAYFQSWFNVPVSFAQVGDVPAGARSVRFVARNIGYGSRPEPPGPFELSMDGQPLQVVTVAQTGGDFVFGADVTAWAGATTELRIGLPAFGVSTQPGFAHFDAITFSELPVPEPGAGLISLIAASLLIRPKQERRGLN